MNNIPRRVMGEFTAAEVWRYENWSWDAIAAAIGGGRVPSSVRTAAYDMGFRREGECEPFVEGPCIECDVAWPRADIDRSFRCPVCAEPLPPEEQELQSMLARERAGRDRRARERAEGKRPPLPGDEPQW